MKWIWLNSKKRRRFEYIHWLKTFKTETFSSFGSGVYTLKTTAQNFCLNSSFDRSSIQILCCLRNVRSYQFSYGMKLPIWCLNVLRKYKRNLALSESWFNDTQIRSIYKYYSYWYPYTSLSVVKFESVIGLSIRWFLFILPLLYSLYSSSKYDNLCVNKKLCFIVSLCTHVCVCVCVCGCVSKI